MIKAFFKWVYDWVTVLAASLVGLPSVTLDFLTSVGAIDYSPLVGSDKALKIVTTVALIKGICAFAINARKKKAAP